MEEAQERMSWGGRSGMRASDSAWRSCQGHRVQDSWFSVVLSVPGLLNYPASPVMGTGALGLEEGQQVGTW